MKIKLWIILLLISSIIPIVNSGEIIYNNPNLPIVTKPISITSAFNSSNATCNSTNYWDTLNVPTDIPNSQYWYNHTIATYNLWDERWRWKPNQAVNTTSNVTFYNATIKGNLTTKRIKIVNVDLTTLFLNSTGVNSDSLIHFIEEGGSAGMRIYYDGGNNTLYFYEGNANTILASLTRTTGNFSNIGNITTKVLKIKRYINLSSGDISYFYGNTYYDAPKGITFKSNESTKQSRFGLKGGDDGVTTNGSQILMLTWRALFGKTSIASNTDTAGGERTRIRLGNGTSSTAKGWIGNLKELKLNATKVDIRGANFTGGYGSGPTVITAPSIAISSSTINLVPSTNLQIGGTNGYSGTLYWTDVSLNNCYITTMKGIVTNMACIPP